MIARCFPAVEIYRRLAQERPDAFLPYLAAALNNLSRSLADPGRRAPALEAIEEASEIYRAPEDSYPAMFASNLADCLRLREQLSNPAQR